MGDEPVRVLALWSPDWPVTAAARAAHVPAHVPAAVFVANRVLACSAVARAQGIRRGLRRREAQARCPDLAVLAPDPDRDARAFEPVVAAVEELAPGVEVVRPGLVALPAQGPAGYFGGELVAAERLVDQVAARTGAECQVGLADGLFAAVLAARRGVAVAPGDTPAFLAPLEVDELDREPDVDRGELVGLLHRLGLRSLGAFGALDASDVASRFGADAVLAHRLARGLDPRPPVRRHPPEELTVELELDPPVDRVDAAAFAARGLAERLHRTLAGHGLSCTRLGVAARTTAGEQLVRIWRCAEPLTPAGTVDRVRWQLDSWLTRGGSGAVDRLWLVPEETVTAGALQLGLWGEIGEADERAGRALVRVQALLGPESVVTAVLVGGRDPAERVRLVPWGDSRDLSGADATTGAVGAPGAVADGLAAVLARPKVEATGSAATGPAAIGSDATGSDATGSDATGPAATGWDGVGPAATGLAATGWDGAGPAAIGPAAIGPAAIGPAAIGPAATGPAATGWDGAGPAAIGPATVWDGAGSATGPAAPAAGRGAGTGPIPIAPHLPAAPTGSAHRDPPRSSGTASSRSAAPTGAVRTGTDPGAAPPGAGVRATPADPPVRGGTDAGARPGVPADPPARHRTGASPPDPAARPGIRRRPGGGAAPAAPARPPAGPGTPPVGPDELRERLEPSTAPAGWPGDVLRATGRAAPTPSTADERPPRPTNRRRRPPARRSTPRSAVREPPPPWPGRLPPPSPAAVPAEPVPVELFDADGLAVRLAEPDLLSAPPVLLVVDGGPAGESGAVRAWAGPWPVQQRWWAAEGGAGSRLQLVCADGTGYLLTARAGRWWITGVYD